MDDLVRAGASSPDAVYTLTINLMWQLYYEAADQGVRWLETDLLTAISELDCGPWRHLGATPDVQGTPFTMLCALLDLLLEELDRRTPGLSARVAIAKARGWLDPAHAG